MYTSDRLIRDMWPDSKVPLTFTGIREPSPEADILRVSTTESVQINTPIIGIPHDSQEPIEKIEDAIAISTLGLGLVSGSSFEARVLQLAQLSVGRRTLIVTGTAGCGKSEIIKTWALAERDRGKSVNIQSVFTKALPDPRQLLGFFDKGVWQDGLLASLLRKVSSQIPPASEVDLLKRSSIEIVQLDGDMTTNQVELITNVLQSDSTVVFANNERIVTPHTLRFVWETISLESVAPALLAQVGIVSVGDEDVGWRLPMTNWLNRRPDATERRLLSNLCDIYLPIVLEIIHEGTRPEMLGKRISNDIPRLQTSVTLNSLGVIQTFTTLLDALANPLGGLVQMTDTEVERCFCWALIWSVGGAIENRKTFSYWWRKTFPTSDMPEEDTIFDYTIDGETRDWVHWKQFVSAYSGPIQDGIPFDAFVPSIRTTQILHLLNLFSDASKSVLLFGPNGSGKTSIVNERIRTACSGEVAELSSLTINCNM